MNPFISRRQFMLADADPIPPAEDPAVKSRLIKRLHFLLSHRADQLDITHYQGATIIRWRPTPDPCAFAILWPEGLGGISFHPTQYWCEVEIRNRLRNKSKIVVDSPLQVK